MILYGTKKTIERFNIPTKEKLPNDIKEIANNILREETDDSLLEWGMKIFYFDGRKCIQLVNFASRFTIFIFDLHNDQVQYIGHILGSYLLDLFSDDKTVTNLLKKLFNESPICVFSNLTNKSVISSLNSNESYFMLGGNRFYSYIEDGILKTKDINREFNWNYLVTVTIDGKKDYAYPAEEFKKLLLQRYSDNK